MTTPIDPKAAEELAKKLQDVKNASNEATKAFQEQLRIITQMRDVMSQVSDNMKAMCQDCATMTPETWQEVTKAVEANNGAMTKSAKVTSSLAAASKKASKQTKEAGGATKALGAAMRSDLVKGAIIATGALNGFGQGIRNITGLVKGLTGVFGSILGALVDLGKALWNTGANMASALGDMANAGAGGNELAAAYQDVVKVFGTLNSGSGKAIVSAAHNIDSLNKTGISSQKIFGNMAERVKAAQEMAVGLGSTMNHFSSEVEKNGGAMLIFNKALGVSSEEMAGISQYALRMGESITSVQGKMAKGALHMAAAFKLDAKVLSKDMGKAMGDLAHFGHLSSKEMLVTATFAQKMGVSIDKLTGIMDATSTFDQTAEGMSKLNQQFGLNIDFTEMMTAQSPEEKLALLSKEFERTGKDLSKLSNAERQLIKTSATLSDEALNSMAAHKDMADVVKDLNKEAGKNEDKTLSQADAMKQLAKNIEVLTPDGGGMRNTVTGNISEGIWKGISMSPKFIQLMKQIREIFRSALDFGYKLGKLFMNWGDGGGSIMDGLIGIFNPARYKKLFGGILEAFDILKKGGPEATKEFFKKILTSFKDFFGSGGGAVSTLLKGLKNVSTFVRDAVVGLGNFIVDGLKDIIPMVVSGIKDFLKWITSSGAKEAGAGLTASATDWFKPLIDLLGRFVTEVGPLLYDAVLELLEAMGKFIQENPKIIFKAITIMLAIAFGPALLGAAMSSISSALISSIGGMLSGVGTSAMAAIGPAFSGIGTTLVSALSGAAIAAAVVYAAVNVGESIKKYGKVLEDKGFDPATAKIAAGTTGLINTLTLGLLPEDLQGKIAESFAKMYEWIFESLTKFLGPSFATSLKENLASQFQIFGGIGDLIMSLWNGDEKGTEQAFRDIGEGVLKALIMSLEFLKIEIPLAVLKLGPWLMKGFFALTEWIFGGLETIFHKLENIPILGPLFGLIGDIFGKLKGLATSLKNFFGDIIEFLNLIDIPAVFKEAWDAISDFFKSSEDGANGFLSGFAEWGMKLVSFIEAPFIMIRELFNAVFSWDSNMSLFENLSNKIQNIGNILSDFWNKWVDQFAEVFVGGFVRAKEWFSKNFTWESFKSIVTGIGDGLQGQFSKITEWLSDPFKAGMKKIKIFFGIRSASTEMADVGKDLADGLKNGTDRIPEDMKKTSAAASEALKNGITPATVTPGGITSKQIEDTGKMIEAVIAMAGKIPVNDTIKQKLEFINSVLDTLGKVISVIGDIGAAGDKKNLINLENNMGFIFNILQTLNGDLRKDHWVASLGDLTNQFDRMNVSKISSEHATTVGALLESLNKITTAISGASSSVTTKDTETPIQAIGRQLVFVNDILKLLSGEDVGATKGIAISALTKLIDGLKINTATLGNSDNLVKLSERLTELSTSMGKIPESMASVKKSFTEMSTASGNISVSGMAKNIQAVQEMVAKTQELDNALTKLPNLNFPAKLSSIANGMGIGGQFAYTVQSKEVVINLSLEISMDVDKVENVIITRKESIIRDRINFIMNNSSSPLSNNSETPTKKIVASGVQGVVSQT